MLLAKCIECGNVKPVFKTFRDEKRANRPATYWNAGYRGKVTNWCQECYGQAQAQEILGKRRQLAKTLQHLRKINRAAAVQVLRDIKHDGNYPQAVR